MPNINYSLEPYVNNWDYYDAAHLIRRTTFAYDRASIEAAVSLGREASVDKLLEDLAEPIGPINVDNLDLQVPINQTWVNANSFAGSLNYRRDSLASWTVELMMDKQLNIREKMVLFWHNHFAIKDVDDPHFLYRYSRTLRNNAVGNFRQLTKEITIDPSMLRFLNGNENSKRAPNENYARELLELFTVGKGPQIAPNDYTNYTEEDIQQMARVLTGWVATGYRGQNLGIVDSLYIANRHDDGEKQLSSKFNNTLIQFSGDQEYANLIDIIFEQAACARNICRKLYRWFVHYKIDDDVENIIISELSQLLISNNYEVKPVLHRLLNSQHFYDLNMRGCLIKNPFEFFIPLVTATEIKLPVSKVEQYGFYGRIFGAGSVLEMIYYYVPQVAGWKAYYQEPGFNRYWINNITLSLRSFATDVALFFGIEAKREIIKIDLLELISTFSVPQDPNVIVKEAARLFYVFELTQIQIDELKEVLIPGLPDMEWTMEYGLYLDDPDNRLIKASITLKIANMFKRMMNMPEFQLF